jgi:hypothetical protein
MGDLTALQHDMVDREIRKAAAHGETSVTGTNDDCRDWFNWIASSEGADDNPWAQFTTTVTFVGLVTIS